MKTNVEDSTGQFTYRITEKNKSPIQLWNDRLILQKKHKVKKLQETRKETHDCDHFQIKEASECVLGDNLLGKKSIIKHDH